jgi:SAM-dependent methyltransferase
MSPAGARDLGDFPTPHAVAAILARETLRDAAHGGEPPSVLDPACGEGALLLAAGALLQHHGADTAGRSLTGVEIDPGRAAGARRALVANGLGGARVVQADALLRPAPLRDAGFDVVIGNPPFLSPTAQRGALPASLRRALNSRLPEGMGALTNMAALFLAEAMQLVRPGGTVGMILPASFLTSRDAAPVRAAVLREGTLEWLWTGGTGVFAASVTVCGVVIRRAGGPRATIRRAEGTHAQPADAARFDATAHQDGRPWRTYSDAPEATTGALVRDITTPVVGFRRHYYATAGALRDDRTGPGRPLATAGLIDPGRALWGIRPARVAKADWTWPRVDDALLRDRGEVTPWLDATHVPKVLVATQTRVIECMVDEAGDVIPGVPVIALPIAGADAWRLAAALTSPYLSKLAFTRHAGAALSPDAIKMSGTEVGDLPLPVECAAWDRAAAALREAARASAPDEWRGALARVGAEMGAAYGLSPRDDPFDWWCDRLPPFRVGASSR